MKSAEEIRQVKSQVEAQFLNRPGVTGVDVGYKYSGGQNTGELAIRVHVAEKKNVAADQAIPKEIAGIKTDVLQRRYVLHPAMVKEQDVVAMVDNTTYDPLKGGISIGPCRSVGGFIFAGTLGAVVIDNVTNHKMLLSNFHVMCIDNTSHVGDTMTQPSRVDGGSCPGGVVGALQRSSLGGQVDCAVSSQTARGVSCSIVDIGTVAGKGTAAIGMKVRKRGRTTLLTHGTVDSIDLSVNIDYGPGLGVKTLTHQISITNDIAQNPKFGDHGDSGSVVVDDSRKIVGLYFAGSDDGQFGVANPIQAVLDALKISLCTGIKKIEKFETKEIKFEKFEKFEIKEHKLEKLEIIEKPFFEVPKTFEGGDPGNPGFPTGPGGPGDPRGPIFGGQAQAGGVSPMKSIFVEKSHLEKTHKEVEKLIYKEIKDRKDSLEYVQLPQFPIPGPGPVEGRLAAIEAAVTEMAHFIQAQFRPDMRGGALSSEPDVATGGGVPHKTHVDKLREG